MIDPRHRLITSDLRQESNAEDDQFVLQAVADHASRQGFTPHKALMDLIIKGIATDTVLMRQTQRPAA